MQTAELVREQPKQTIEGKAAPTGIKTMLFHVHDDESLDTRLQVALSLARVFGAHLHLLHVNPIEAYTVADAYGTLVNRGIVEILEEEAQKLKARIEKELSSEDVTWDYEEVTGVLLPHLIQCAALADLVITGRQPQVRGFDRPAITLIGDLLSRVRSPLLVIGDETRDIDLFGPAMIAWNGSYEAANAMRNAIPMLKLASQVRLVSVEEPKHQQFPSTRAMEYLSRHGISAELTERPVLAYTVEEELLDQADVDRADYIVMGAYSHNRAGEFLFGGVTRSLLKECPTSLLMAH
jgi:nucleotide-binding universal stress UspA family protein